MEINTIKKAVSCSSLRITSSVFKAGEFIPDKYICDGEFINPPLEIGWIPESTKSLVLIMDLPDVFAGIWIHWIAWNIPVTLIIPENYVPGIHGMNKFKSKNYGNPCPSAGTYRYFFKIYALNRLLDLPNDTTKLQLANAMKEYVIASGELMGQYKHDAIWI